MGTAANVTHHANIVREKSVLRSLISVSSTIASDIAKVNTDADNMSDYSSKVKINAEELSSLASQLNSVVGHFRW
jgi:replicative DNA helicase